RAARRPASEHARRPRSLSPPRAKPASETRFVIDGASRYTFAPIQLMQMILPERRGRLPTDDRDRHLQPDHDRHFPRFPCRRRSPRSWGLPAGFLGPPAGVLLVAARRAPPARPPRSPQRPAASSLSLSPLRHPGAPPAARAG